MLACTDGARETVERERQARSIAQAYVDKIHGAARGPVGCERVVSIGARRRLRWKGSVLEDSLKRDALALEIRGGEHDKVERDSQVEAPDDREPRQRSRHLITHCPARRSDRK
eukprot:scaffold48809_cov75-Phaeocystis_antarctica.AAC.5